MPAFKPEQRHLIVRGRSFHFVSYEPRPANAHRGEEEQPAMWYLMVNGRRFAAFPCDARQSSAEIDQALMSWAEQHAVGPARSTPAVAGQKPPASKHRRTWWGPN